MARSDMRNMVAALSTRGIGAFKSKISGAALAMRGLGKGAAGATAAVRGFASASVLATGALAGLGTAAAVKSFADLDEALTESQAIMGELTTKTMARMERQALNVSSSMVQSAEEAARGYFFLSSAGLSAQQSIKSLPTVAKFAQAGLFNMSEATELLTDAQSALGLSVQGAAQNMKNMKRVGDVLVKANTMANATVREFAQALTNRAAPAMRAMNIELEEGVAVLAAFADQGIKGRRAGTMFSRVLRRLRMSAQENTEAFKALGVIDAEGNLRNMATVVQVLESELQGLSNTTQAARLEQLGFNARMQDAILPLIGTSDEIANFERQARMAQGTMEAISDNQMDTLNKQFDLMGDNIVNISKDIGGAFEPAVMLAAQGMNKLLGFMRSESVRRAGDDFKFLAEGAFAVEEGMREAAASSQTLNLLVTEAITPVEELKIASMEVPSIWETIVSMLTDATDKARELKGVLSEMQQLRTQVRDQPFLIPGIGPSRLRELALGHRPGRLSQQAARAAVGRGGVQMPLSAQQQGLPVGHLSVQQQARELKGGFTEVGQVFNEQMGSALEGMSDKGPSAARAISSQLLPALSHLATAAGGAGSTVGKIANFASQLLGGFLQGGPVGVASGALRGFAGFFQHGGHIGRGQFGFAGEAGMELVQGPAQVTPMSDASITVKNEVPVEKLPEPRGPRESARDREWLMLFSETVDAARQSGVDI